MRPPTDHAQRPVVGPACRVRTPRELVDRLRELESAGLHQVMLLPPLAVRDQVLSDVAEQVMPHLT